MGISIGLVGLGAFGSEFAELFKAHPLVDRVALCDREPDRVAAFAKRESWRDKLNPKDCYTSLDDICRSDVDALVIITQHWLHAPQCVQAMEAGKHVYSAVPIITIPDGDETLEWCDKLVRTATRTGKFYMYGETTYYRPEAMFCRRKAAEGAFGDFVYAEGEYFHDVDDHGCCLRHVIAHRLAGKAGEEWARMKQRYMDNGVKEGPMHYPTHSTSGPVCVMNAHAEKVTAYGFRNRNNDSYFDDAEFSNETAFFKMSNGATVRICEHREIAGSIDPEHETFRVMGTRGTFVNGTWKEKQPGVSFCPTPLIQTNLTPADMRDPLPPDVLKAFQAVRPNDFYGGHGGSHAYLVNEFADAIARERTPAINVWEAVRYMAMGVMAHKSAMRDGETLDVPDWGDAPSDK